MNLCNSFLILVIVTTAAAHIPSYIKPCSRKGSNFDACALEHAKYAIPFIVKGDKHLKIASMQPLQIPLVDLNAGGNFNLTMKNIKIYGLEKIVPLSIKTNFEKKTITIVSELDNLNILGDYEIKGKIVILPIEGQGPLNITLVGGTYTYDCQYEIEERGGKQFAKLIENQSHYDYKLKNIIYHFENLFNGDKLLGDEMNKFLNDNWMDVEKDLKKPFIETLLVFHNDLFERFFSHISYNELFLE